MKSKPGSASSRGGEKKALAKGKTIVFLDETGFSQRPAVRTTWAPKGKTPVLRENFNWKKLSAIVALGAARAGRPRMLFDLVEGAFTGPLVLCFLVDLPREINGPILLVWDNTTIHRTAEIKVFLLRPDVAARLEVLPLPGYAPQLNPEELVNAHIKAQRMANHAPETLEDLRRAAQAELRRAARRTTMLKNILTSSKHGLLNKKDIGQPIL